MRFFREIRRFLADDRGAVTMEYLLLCVMIAAASVMMVIAFSRAVARQFAMVSYAMSGYAQEQLEEGVKQFRQAEKDIIFHVLHGFSAIYFYHSFAEKRCLADCGMIKW